MDMPLYEQIYNYLLDKVKSGELKSGDRVPSEKELAEQFHVSRITSKRALEMLSMNHIIERIQGKGSFVADNLPDLNALTPLDSSAEEASGAPKTSASGSEERVLAFILPDFADSYGLRLIHGVEERCSSLGIRMFLKLTYDKREVEEEAIRSFANLADGIIIFPVHGEHYNTELLRLVLDKYPLVLVDRYLKGVAAAAVYTDNRKSALELTNILFERGHTRIGFISSPAENTSTIEDRLAGFTEAFSRRGLGVRPEYVITNLYSSLPRSFESRKIQLDVETVRRFVELNPELTGFVVAEYNLARIVREALLSLGRRIPEDCQIVCYDSPEDPFEEHLFTHVRQNEYEMGAKAVDLLAAQWNGEKIPMHTTVPYAIMKGASTT